MSNERKHHPLSPSKLNYLEASPCFEGENNENEASLAGTKCHKAVETGDLTGLTDEQMEAVEECITYRDSVVASYDKTRKELSEIYLSVDDLSLFEGFTGTTGGFVDTAIMNHDQTRADILDWKFVRWPVIAAEENLQGMAYALGLINKYPTLEQVTVHFVQPYLRCADIHTFTREQLQVSLTRVLAVVHRAKQWREDYSKGKEVKFYPTAGTCMWCARKGGCSALHTHFIKVLPKFAPLQLPKELSPSLINDPQQAGVALMAAELAKAWGEAVRRQVTLRVIEGAPEPEGYRLVESDRTKVIDVDKAIAIASEYLAKEDIEECRDIHLTPLKKKISDKAPRGKKKDAIEEFEAKLLAVEAVKENHTAYLKMNKPDEEE